MFDKALSNFTLITNAILGFSKIGKNRTVKRLEILYGANNMNMISTGAFQNEMDASDKQPTTLGKLVGAWEKKNAKAARAGGVSLIALSLAACGSSDSLNRQWIKRFFIR